MKITGIEQFGDVRVAVCCGKDAQEFTGCKKYFAGGASFTNKDCDISTSISGAKVVFFKVPDTFNGDEIFLMK